MAVKIELILYDATNEGLSFLVDNQVVYHIDPDEKAIRVEVSAGKHEITLRSDFKGTANTLFMEAEDWGTVKVYSCFDKKSRKRVFYNEQNMPVALRKKLSHKPYRITRIVVNLIGLLVMVLGTLGLLLGYWSRMLSIDAYDEASIQLISYLIGFGFLICGMFIIRVGRSIINTLIKYKNETRTEKITRWEKECKSASNVSYFIGIVTAIWGITFLVIDIVFVNNLLEVGENDAVLTIVEGIVFIVLGVLIRKKINISLIIALVLYIGDTAIYLFNIVSLIGEGYVVLISSFIAGILFRIIFLIPVMIKGVNASHQLKKSMSLPIKHEKEVNPRLY